MKQYLATIESKLPACAITPLCLGYQRKINISPELDPTKAAYDQSLIGVWQWIVELGRIDIMYKVSMMASMMVLPHEGHIVSWLHIFSYLCSHHNAELVLDPLVPDFDVEGLSPQTRLMPHTLCWCQQRYSEGLPRTQRIWLYNVCPFRFGPCRQQDYLTLLQWIYWFF